MNGLSLMCSRIILHFFQPFFIVIRLSQNESHLTRLCYLIRTKKHKFPTSFNHPRVLEYVVAKLGIKLWRLEHICFKLTWNKQNQVGNLSLTWVYADQSSATTLILFFCFGSESLILFALKLRRAYEGNDLNIA